MRFRLLIRVQLLNQQFATHWKCEIFQVLQLLAVSEVKP